jgi:two-component system response regulator GlrR
MSPRGASRTAAVPRPSAVDTVNSRLTVRRRPRPNAVTVATDRDTTLITLADPHTARMPQLRLRAKLKDGTTIDVALGVSAVVVGKDEACDIVLDDPKVSRRHCEIRLTEAGPVLRDLGSKNGTFLQGVALREAVLAPGVTVSAGVCELTVEVAGAPLSVPLSIEARFGDALGGSLVMRQLFEQLRRAAASDATILLTGESGTGKELLARAIHEHSPRKDGPFAVFDCSVADAALLSAELFGHEKGAFTDAKTAKKGVLAEADGGTLFIDEVGELPMDLQPKLLRALEARKYRPLGCTEWRSFDARVVAATHRNLRARVAAGQFREDLYYRLAVVEAKVPPLRERRDDIPLLAAKMLAASAGGPREVAKEVLSLLSAHDWPGNVRELRNVVTRLVLFPDAPLDLPVSPAGPRDALGLGSLLGLNLSDARKTVVARFERAYVEAKLNEAGGNVTRTAERMGITRQRLYDLMEQHGITRRG